MIWRKLSNRPIPPWLRAAAGTMSLYDYGTTFAGLGTVVWLQQAGCLVPGVLTLVLTFALETIVSVALAIYAYLSHRTEDGTPTRWQRWRAWVVEHYVPSSSSDEAPDDAGMEPVSIPVSQSSMPAFLPVWLWRSGF